MHRFKWLFNKRKQKMMKGCAHLLSMGHKPKPKRRFDVVMFLILVGIIFLAVKPKAEVHIS